ncbi:MAG: NHL repeat-containing protein [Candidatus Zixiibacteriota bacterium]
MRSILPTCVCLGTAILSGAVLVVGCGEKIPLPTGIQNDPSGRLLDTVYIAVVPHWTGAGGIPFVRPRGVSVGYDRTIYVCDSVNNRVVRLDTEGNFLEQYTMPGPVAVTQDRGLNLVAVNNTRTVWVRRFLAHGDFVAFADADSFQYCRPIGKGDSICMWLLPRLLDITSSPDAAGWFYVNEDWSGQILRFTLGYPQLSNVFRRGSAIGQVYAATGVATSPVGTGGYRLIVTQYGPEQGVQYFDGSTKLPVITDASADVYHRTLADYKTVAADRLGNVYILHREAAQVMVFDKRGRYVLAFGQQGTDSLGLSSPSGIAVLDETILIADTGNNRIVRYQMTAVPEN